MKRHHLNQWFPNYGHFSWVVTSLVEMLEKCAFSIKFACVQKPKFTWVQTNHMIELSVNVKLIITSQFHQCFTILTV